MRISSFQKSFDEYSRNARLYPGLIAAAPIILVTALFLPREPTLIIASIVVSAGMTFLLASFVRSRGKNLEKRLIKTWDGLPTTKMLRHRHPRNAAQFERRRERLEDLYRKKLPTRSEEAAHPDRADDTYVDATRILVIRVNEQRADFPRVHEENISYGFARNLLGLKPIAIIVILLAVIVDGVVILKDGNEVVAVSILALHLALLVFWVLFVKPSWVLQAGQTYAERLFETLDSPRLQSSSREKQ
jgi:hypothetical protein